MKNNLFKLATLVVCILLLVSAGFADKGKKTPSSKAAAVKDKPTESAKKEQAKPKPDIITPAQVSPKKDQPAPVIKPAELPQTEVLSASAVKDKGRQIKWQLICAGSGCGDNQALLSFEAQELVYLCGTVGQVAVGRGSSPSFGMNQGFWQETITTEYVRGDANGDDIINVGDIVYLVSYLYKGGPAPNPVWVGDCNCDEIVNIGDIVYLVSYLYKGGPPPVC